MSEEHQGERQSAPLFHVAMTSRCPRCGKGPLFNGFLTVATSCSVCGLRLDGHDTGDGPAFFIMMPLCILVAVAALYVDMTLAPPLWLHALIWPPVVAVVVGVTLRPVKALMIALQYRHRDVENVDSSGQQ